MSAPSFRSDFTSGQRRGWYAILENTTSTTAPFQYCAVSGRSFIKRLQSRLGAMQTGAWDAGTAEKLANAARVEDMNAPDQGYATVADILDGDLGNQRASKLGMRFGIWYAYLRGTTSRAYDVVVVPDDAILPQWNVAPADDAGVARPDGSAICWANTASPPSSVAGGSGSTGSTGSGSQTPAAQAAPSKLKTVLTLVGVAAGVIAVAGVFEFVSTRGAGRARRRSS